MNFKKAIKALLLFLLFSTILCRLSFIDLYGKGSGKNLIKIDPLSMTLYSLITGLRERGFSVVNVKKAIQFLGVPGELYSQLVAYNNFQKKYLSSSKPSITVKMNQFLDDVFDNAKKWAQSIEKDLEMKNLLNPKTSSPVLSLSAVGIVISAFIVLLASPKEGILSLVFFSVIFYTSLTSAHPTSAKLGEGFISVTAL